MTPDQWIQLTGKMKGGPWHDARQCGVVFGGHPDQQKYRGINANVSLYIGCQTQPGPRAASRLQGPSQAGGGLCGLDLDPSPAAGQAGAAAWRLLQPLLIKPLLKHVPSRTAYPGFWCWSLPLISKLFQELHKLGEMSLWAGFSPCTRSLTPLVYTNLICREVNSFTVNYRVFFNLTGKIHNNTCKNMS